MNDAAFANVEPLNKRARIAMDRRRQRLEDWRLVKAASLSTNWNWALDREQALFWIPEYGESETWFAQAIGAMIGAPAP